MQTQQNEILDIILSSLGIDYENMDALASAVVNRKNIIIAGGTASGKTTLLDSILNQVKDDSVVVIEAYRELTNTSTDNTRYIASSDITSMDESAIRQLANDHSRIVIGEIRTAAVAKLFVKASNGGHNGNIATIHGTSKPSVMESLGLLCASWPDPISPDDVRKAVDIIVFVQKMEDGKRSISVVNCED